jgi:uncharacterized repeat protein (TIGR01451 family)
VWLVGTLADDATATLTINATVVSSAAQTNTATISDADQFDPDPVNNAASATETPLRSDLSITKTDGQSTDIPGTSITYTIVVTNDGPDAATDVLVVDIFAAALTAVTWTSIGSAGVVGNDVSGSGNINDTVSFIPVGSTVTYTVTATINPATTGSLANTATVSPPAGVTDADPADNSATDIDTLTPQADLSLTKTNNVTTAVPGSPVTYTIVVSNRGPSAVSGVSVSDPLPAGVTAATWVVTATSGGGAVTGPASGSGALVTTVDLPANATVTFTFTVQVDPAATGSLTNMATVSPPAGVTDPDPSDNSATDTDTLALPAFSSLSGSVYVDRNNDGERSADEVGVPGVTIRLTGTDNSGNAVNATVVTDASGNYRLTRMLPGTYTLTEVHPAEFLDGTDRAGSLGGQAGNDVISGIVLGPNQDGTGYLFGERGLMVISKRPFITPNPGPVTRPPGSGVTEVNPLSGTPAAGPLTASFEWLPAGGPIGTMVRFDALELAGPAQIVSWLWSFGDGSQPSNLPAPEHEFAIAGVYQVTLSVTDIFGRMSAVSQPILVGIGLVNGTLLIPGTDSADSIKVSAASKNRVLVQTSFTSPTNRYFAARDVKRILVYGLGGDDQITIGPALRLPAEIYGDDGNDVLRGGGGSNRLSGGAGVDKIYGGAAGDILWGGDDRDWLSGLAGQDLLFGDLGDDALNGGAGNDVLVGGDGNDWLQGGGGSDVLIGGAGADTLAKNTGSALQIAGSTSHDLHVAALQAILAEWANTKHTLAAKRASLPGLRSDRRNGNYFLISSGSQATVFQDNAADRLNTVQGRDWWLLDGVLDLVVISKKKK